VQYACTDLKEQLKGLAVVQSMGKKGNCWDNALAESFFKTLKTELVYHTNYPTKHLARLAVFEYIEGGYYRGWYNKRRCHWALGNPSPQQHQLYLEAIRIAA
jgi:transposase InsO family protein